MKIGKLQLFVEVRAKKHTLGVVIGSTVLNTRLCTERNDAFDLCHFIVCISFTFFALCCTEWNWEGICDCDDEMFFLGVGENTRWCIQLFNVFRMGQKQGKQWNKSDRGCSCLSREFQQQATDDDSCWKTQQRWIFTWYGSFRRRRLVSLTTEPHQWQTYLLA